MADYVLARRPFYGDAVTWFGHACFRVADAEGHTVVVDPYPRQVVGQSLEGLTADVVLVTHESPDPDDLQAIRARKVIHAVEQIRDGKVRRVGDAATGLVFTLIPTDHDAEHGEHAVVVWEQEGVKFCHLGDLGHVLVPEEVQEIGHPDVLMVPVGGHYTIDGEKARQVVDELKPHVVIPMHYKVPGKTNPELPLETEEAFLRADGHAPWDTIERLDSPVLVVDPDNLPFGTQVDVLIVAEVEAEQ